MYVFAVSGKICFGDVVIYSVGPCRRVHKKPRSSKAYSAVYTKSLYSLKYISQKRQRSILVADAVCPASFFLPSYIYVLRKYAILAAFNAGRVQHSSLNLLSLFSSKRAQQLKHFVNSTNQNSGAGSVPKLLPNILKLCCRLLPFSE